MTHYQPIPGTPIELIAPAPVWPHCQRCGFRFHDARKDTIHCASCRQTIWFEQRCEAEGIDLAALADDEFVVWVHGTDNVYRVEIVKEEHNDAVAA